MHPRPETTVTQFTGCSPASLQRSRLHQPQVARRKNGCFVKAVVRSLTQPGALASGAAHQGRPLLLPQKRIALYELSPSLLALTFFSSSCAPPSLAAQHTEHRPLHSAAQRQAPWQGIIAGKSRCAMTSPNQRNCRLSRLLYVTCDLGEGYKQVQRQQAQV